MDTICLDPQTNLTAVDFDPFAETERSVATLVTTQSAKKMDTSNQELAAIDFDPFIDGEILLTAPATAAQKEMWLAVQISPEANLACLLSQSLQLTGKLNQSALQQAFQELIARHESLRMTFSGNGNSILIAADAALQISVIDLSYVTGIEQALELEKQHQQAVNTQFDLQRGPLFNAKVVKLHEAEHVVIFTIHHIVCDGWSFGIITTELAALYSAFSQGLGLSPELEQADCFSEYAYLEQAKIDLQEQASTEAYWLQKFTGLPPIVDLPHDFPRPLLRTFNSDREYHTLSAQLVNDLKQLGIQQRSSLMTTLLVAFEVFLAKLTGQTDLVIGVPTAGQTAEGKYNLVGHCVNFLPIRSLLQSQRTFSEQLQARNSEILDDYDHQEFTYGRLLQKLSIPRNAERIPLITAVFNIDLAGGSHNNQFGDLATMTKINRSAYAAFEFFLNGAVAADGKLHLDCQYNTKLFTAETIQQRLAEFEHLLIQIARAPETSIDQLSLLTPSQQQQLIDWNCTTSDYPRDRCIHQLFAEQVVQHPQKIALVAGKEQLTYQELNHRANQVAHHLLAKGVQPDELVGLAVARSIHTIVGMLGILKAGAAYLPLDLAYPQERLAFMCENAVLRLLLTTTDLVTKVPVQNVETICLDQDWSTIPRASQHDPEPNITAQHLAYVMYTSGSTGQPKGVCVPHQGVVRLVKSTNYLKFSADQVFLQLAPVSFDAATLEIWGSLLNGAKLVLFPSTQPSLTELGQILRQERITTLWLTAGLFHLMVDQRLDDLIDLRYLLAGGDVLSVPQVQKVLANLPNCQLINGYGPTENTTFTCCYPVTTGGNSVPIGRPISNTQVYVFDTQQQPVPIGVPGELYVGGDGLARGYLNRPDLTDEKFINHVQGRLYRTGDLVRYLPDGNLEFLGRIDSQVKIRGFRLELGEITAALIQHPRLRAAVVIDREDQPGDKRLVAYVVSDHPPTDQELVAFLQTKLPDYMIPSAFMAISALPLTVNGKVDRQALPVPEYSRQAALELVTARDDIEQQLTVIWEKVLGVSPIGITDNFFELGGHSLIAVKLFVEIEQVWQQNLPLATLFQKQTIVELATVLRQQEWAAPWSSLVQIQVGDPQHPPLFCIHPVGGNVLEYYTLAGYLGQEQPVYGLQSRGLDGKTEPCDRIEDMAYHYIQEMQTVQPQGPYFLTGYSFGGLVAYEIARQLVAAGQPVGLLALLDSSAPGLPPRRPGLIQAVGIHLQNLCQLQWPERVSYVGDRLAYRLNQGDEKDFLANNLYKLEDLTPQLINVLNANLDAGEHYTAKAYPGKVTLFRCRVQDLEHYLHPEFGWPTLVQELEIHPIPGPHFSMLKEPRIQFLAQELKSCLQKKQASVG
jgi:amino acid adenylation domain-containing protein